MVAQDTISYWPGAKTRQKFRKSQQCCRFFFFLVCYR